MKNAWHPPSLKLPSWLWQASPRQAGVASCPWQIEYEGALYHVLSRGNNQRYIFVTDDDRYLFLDTIGQMSERFENDIFVYVLMDNHYHLLLRTAKANLSRSMQSRYSALLVMAGRQVYKSEDWGIIWINTLISEPTGDNHQETSGVRAKLSKTDRND